MTTIKQNLLVTGVRVIPVNSKVARPLVVFSVQGHDDIVLAPNQALIALQNSGRAVGIVDAMSPQAQLEYHKLIGVVANGEFSYHKAGDTYLIDENHPAITGNTHKLSGQVKVGDKVPYEQDGFRIEGFLAFPFTQGELNRMAIADKVAEGFLASFGISSFALPQVVNPVTNTTSNDDDDVREPVDMTTTEAFGAPVTASRKK